MEFYLGEGYQAGAGMLVSIMQELAGIVGIPLALLAYLKIINELKSSPASNMMLALGRFLKPTIIFLLVGTFSQWTDLIGGAVYYITDYVDSEYAERMASNKKFVDERGEPIDPWLYYQNTMIKARERENNKAASIIEAYENLPDDQKTEAVTKQYAEKFKKEIDEDPSYIGQQINSAIFSFVDWFIEGAYFVVNLVIQKVQEALLAFLMAVGILGLLISLIPNREGSFDTWLTYFLSIQLWSVSLVILKVYYNASIIGEIDKLEKMINQGGTTLNYMGASFEYVANCIAYILLFCSVPVLVGFYMVKTGGAEVFSKIIGMTSAGTAAASSYGGSAAGMAGSGVSGAFNAGISGLESYSSKKPGSLTNLSDSQIHDRDMTGLRSGR
jgi:hypothetical protein